MTAALVKAQTERTYKRNGQIVAKNRRPRFEQQGPSLQDYVKSLPEKDRRWYRHSRSRHRGAAATILQDIFPERSFTTRATGT